MDWIKSSLFGILYWIIVFVEVSIIGFTPALAVRTESGFQLNQAGYSVHFVALVIIAFILAQLYYKKEKVRYWVAVQVAGAMSAVALILDSVITVPLFVGDYNQFFLDISLWFGVLLFIVVFALFGSLRRNK